MGDIHEPAFVYCLGLPHFLLVERHAYQSITLEAASISCKADAMRVNDTITYNQETLVFLYQDMEGRLRMNISDYFLYFLLSLVSPIRPLEGSVRSINHWSPSVKTLESQL